MPRRFIYLLIVGALALTACVTPTAAPPDPTQPPTRTVRPPTPTVPEPTATRAPTNPPATPDTRDLLRDPVTDAERASADAIQAADLPIGDLRELSIRLKGLPADTPERTCTAPKEYRLGDQEVFHVSNSQTYEQFEVTATLVAKEPNVYMWVDNQWLGLIDRSALVEAARRFDRDIIPRNRAVFGTERLPGIDCDPRLHVLNTSNTAVGGYFSSSDQYVSAVRPDSNEKDMYVVDIEGRGGPGLIGTTTYITTLAHEHQHIIHYFVDRDEETWVNEGMSVLAEFLNGFGADGLDFAFADEPNTQLNFWPEDGGTGVNYGAAFTFWLYFYDKYGEKGISDIVADPRNGLAGVAGALQKAGFAGTLDDFFAGWVVAKFLDNPSIDDGRYGFERSDPPTARSDTTIRQFPYRTDGPQRVQQYAARYIEFRGGKDVRIDFTGSTKVRLIAADPHSGQHIWWSNRGDSANMRLTREVDLTGVRQASLSYWTWFDSEADWDYGYVTVSEDGGQTYRILQTPTGTDRNPNQNNLGWGYTGNSGGGPEPIWIQESVDLTPYAGKKILLRFEVINDLAVNLPGFAIDDIEIPEIGFQDNAETDTGWTAEGWVRMNNFVPQNFIAQLIGFGKDGTTTVTRLPLNPDNTGAWDLPLSRWNTGLLVLAATAVKTSEPALFTLSAAEK